MPDDNGSQGDRPKAPGPGSAPAGAKKGPSLRSNEPTQRGFAAPSIRDLLAGDSPADPADGAAQERQPQAGEAASPPSKGPMSSSGIPFETTIDHEGDDPTAVTLPPFVEVDLIHERGGEHSPIDSWRSLEIWTQNRIYSVDWSMRCIEVIDRKSGQQDHNHALLGAHLAGGQTLQEEGMELTFPCPRPGSEAVFEYRTRGHGYVNTSTVTRVVLRMRVLTVPRDSVAPTWDQLTGSHKASKAE